jgi:RHS repeat-associated protein
MVARIGSVVEDVTTGNVETIGLAELRVESSGGSAVYVYDKLNQLVGVNNGYDIGMAYNGEGLRVGKVVTNSTDDKNSRYLYERDKVVLELDGYGNQEAYSVYGGNTLICRTVDGQTVYYNYNGHGDVTALTDSNGTILSSYYYDAFGTIIESTGEDENSIAYAGYQYDKETGLYYLNARMYDPKIARFMQEDTYRGARNDPLSLNLYTYCYNEPMMNYDPSGHVVTQYDVEHCTPEQIAAIQAATDAWNAAASIADPTAREAAQVAAHAAAEEARRYTTSASGNIAGVPGGMTNIYLDKNDAEALWKMVEKKYKDSDEIEKPALEYNGESYTLYHPSLPSNPNALEIGQEEPGSTNTVFNLSGYVEVGCMEIPFSVWEWYKWLAGKQDSWEDIPNDSYSDEANEASLAGQMLQFINDLGESVAHFKLKVTFYLSKDGKHRRTTIQLKNEAMASIMKENAGGTYRAYRKIGTESHCTEFAFDQARASDQYMFYIDIVDGDMKAYMKKYKNDNIIAYKNEWLFGKYYPVGRFPYCLPLTVDDILKKAIIKALGSRDIVL